MRKAPHSGTLGSAVAESLSAALARKQAAGQDGASAAASEAPGLLGAYREVLEHESQKDMVRPERLSWWHRIGRPLVGLLLGVTAGWLWLLPPAWLSPSPGPLVTWPSGPAGRELHLINAADAIVLFRNTRGRFPDAMELDTVAPGVSLAPLPDGGFELRAADGHILLAPPPGTMAALSYELRDAPVGTAP
jgi:hypothetical protein